LQCDIWNADCFAHNARILHFIGAMKKSWISIWRALRSWKYKPVVDLTSSEVQNF
jgi:hypothetical protein